MKTAVAILGEVFPHDKIGHMPTVARIGPYRVYFVSHDMNEPPHVHVDREAYSAKFWLEFLEAWRGYFGVGS